MRTIVAALAVCVFLIEAGAQRSPMNGWMYPPSTAASDGCDSACQAAIIDSLQVRFGDSISVPYLHATDSVRTPNASIGTAQISNEVGFYGATPRDRCFLSHSSPPNPVTAAAARAAYDQSLQDCLTETSVGTGLLGTP